MLRLVEFYEHVCSSESKTLCEKNFFCSYITICKFNKNIQLKLLHLHFTDEYWWRDLIARRYLNIILETKTFWKFSASIYSGGTNTVCIIAVDLQIMQYHPSSVHILIIWTCFFIQQLVQRFTYIQFPQTNRDVCQAVYNSRTERDRLQVEPDIVSYQLDNGKTQFKFNRVGHILAAREFEFPFWK